MYCSHDSEAMYLKLTGAVLQGDSPASESLTVVPHDSKPFGHIQKGLGFSPRQFPKAAESTSLVFKTVPPYSKLEILPIHH
ncbi:hypothetical protein E2C01_057440 [Portunus trituberculatus]|uniref:Uncharacterized protein n=1 Tax=Portunus trituberculatus TaxID=210409 RepID=A0A5B7GWT3_PORTR|nr:hypothetical protein [Portunus trituberculatus]